MSLGVSDLKPGTSPDGKARKRWELGPPSH